MNFVNFYYIFQISYGIYLDHCVKFSLRFIFELIISFGEWMFASNGFEIILYGFEVVSNRLEFKWP
jgi:hypothetical protein